MLNSFCICIDFSLERLSSYTLMFFITNSGVSAVRRLYTESPKMPSPDEELA